MAEDSLEKNIYKRYRKYYKKYQTTLEASQKNKSDDSLKTELKRGEEILNLIQQNFEDVMKARESSEEVKKEEPAVDIEHERASAREEGFKEGY